MPMSFEKSPQALIDTFYAVLPEHPGAERRKMFGYPCCFVNGNMFTGLFGNDLHVRLSAEDQAKLLAQPGARAFEPMPGRVMKGYILVPRDMHAKPDELRRWVDKAFGYAGSLPPKQKKDKAAKAPAKAAKPAKAPAAKARAAKAKPAAKKKTTR